jgi:hypothetical protein
MRVNRGLLGWGVFLIVLGIVPLAVRAGYLDADTVRQAWQLWPLILIGIGLGLVLQRTPVAAVGTLVVAVTFGLMGGAVIATGLSAPLSGCSVGFGGGGGTPFDTRTGTLGSPATVDIDLNCGDVTIDAGPGGGWSVAGSDPAGDGPEITAASNSLRVRSHDREQVGLVSGGQRWQVTLPRDPATSLNLSVNAGSGTASLAGAHVPTTNASVNAGDIELDLAGAVDVAAVNGSVNAGSMRLTLPASSITGDLSVNAGSIEVCVPDEVGLRFRGSDNPTGSNNFSARGLVQSGGTWTSPSYESAATRIDLSVDVTLGSITLNPESGCD